MRAHRGFLSSFIAAALYVDLKAAFDSVDPSTLWQLLSSLGFPVKILSPFQALYMHGHDQLCPSRRDLLGLVPSTESSETRMHSCPRSFPGSDG